MNQLFNFGTAGGNQLHAEEMQPVRHVSGRIDQFVENQVPQTDVEQAEADHHHAHHRAGTERDLQAAVQPLAGRLRGPVGSAGRGFHADIAAEAGEETAGQERDRHKGILHLEDRQHREDHEQHEEHHAHHLVLAVKVSHRAFADVPGDLLHPVGTFIGGDHFLVENRRHQQCQHRRERSAPPQRRHSERHGHG